MAVASQGRLQTGTPDPVVFRTSNFKGGLNVQDPLQEVGDNDLTIAIDGYLIATGDGGAGFQSRYGMSSYNSNKTASTSLILARYYQDIQNGSVVTPETTKVLGQLGNTLYSIPSGSGAFTTIGAISNGVTSAAPMTFVRMQEANTAYYNGLTDVLIICTGSGGPYVYDGTHLYTPPGWAQAASAGTVAIVNGIVYFGNIPGSPYQIFGCGDGITAPVESLPAYRNLRFSGPVVGLCASGPGANAALIVGLNNNGLAVVWGSGPTTFYVQSVPMDDGLLTARAMTAQGGTAFLQGHQGVYAYNGSATPSLISAKVQPWLYNDGLQQSATDYPMTGNVNLNWMQVYKNRLHLGYCANASTTPNVILVFDLIVNAWSGPLRPNNGAASMMLFDAPSDPNPYTALIGSSTQGQAMNWDVLPSTPSNPVYDDAPTNTVAVLSQCQTKSFRLGLGGVNKMLTRAYPELYIAGPWAGDFVANADCGNVVETMLVDSLSYLAATNVGTWDVSQWDNCLWGGTAFTRFGPPYTRTDLNLEFREIAVGVETATAQPCWMFVGSEMVVSVRGMT